MSSTDIWLTWERRGNTTTKRSSTVEPHGNGWISRPATVDEINEALDMEERRATDTRLRTDFEFRDDYADAMAIASMIEHMDYKRHPLDKFSPAEWSAFRKKLQS